MIDLLKIQPGEAERIAYAEGFTITAELFARIAELEAERDALAVELDEARDVETLADWENRNGPAAAYRDFFFDCFERLAGHYPAPSVTSDYDQSVIFEAIEKGEGGAE